jgi:hypothetical protein
MLRRVALVRTDVSEERSISSQRASVDNYGYRYAKFGDSCHPDDGGDTFLRNVGSYKSHTA